jgi:hypothetical protein
MNLPSLMKSTRLFIGKNSPAILTGLAAVGLISTVVHAVKSTPKALAIVDSELYLKYLNGKNHNEKFKTFDEYLSKNGIHTSADCGHDIYSRISMLSKKELIKAAWKVYIPSLVMGGLSIACMICATSIHSRRHAALVSIYTLSEKALKEYKNKVIDTIGEKREKKINDEIIKEKVQKTIVEETIIDTGKGDTLCYDALSGRYFRSDIEFIKKTMNEINANLLREDLITLNDLYEALYLDPTKLGDYMGWRSEIGNQIECSFDSHLSANDVPCLILDFVTFPDYLYID